MVARNFKARMSKGSTSYTEGSSSSESESYFQRSELLSSRGGVAIPLRSIHRRLKRPIRRRKDGCDELGDSLGPPALNWKTGGRSGFLSSCMGSGASSSTSMSDEVEAGGVIRYCVFAGRNLSSVPCSLTGDSGSRVRSMWFRFHLRWFCTFISISACSSFSFSANLSDNKTRSWSRVRPSGRTGMRM